MAIHSVLFLIGRLIFGIYWLQAAYKHLFQSGPMIGYSRSVGVKWPKTAVIGTGILLLIGGLSMLTGFAPKIGVIALVIFLLGVSFKMHAYWKVQDPSMKMNQKINFGKNMALLGATLMMLAIATPWVWSFGWGSSHYRGYYGAHMSHQMSDTMTASSSMPDGMMMPQ